MAAKLKIVEQVAGVVSANHVPRARARERRTRARRVMNVVNIRASNHRAQRRRRARSVGLDGTSHPSAPPEQSEELARAGMGDDRQEITS